MGLFGQAIHRLKLEPIFGPKVFDAATTCDDIHPGLPDEHGVRDGLIPDGDRVCCMVCYQTGVPGHPDLKETASDRIRLRDWAPEGGRDRWSGSGPAAEPTRCTKAPERPKRQLRQFQRKAGHPKLIYMDPAAIEDLVARGRAEVYRSPD